jgi:hypothetical protein
VIPPIPIVIIFKIWLKSTYLKAFRYYIPDEADLARSKVVAAKVDLRADKLAKRFGHPALHAELYTPMVHADMVQLLSQVYHGRLSEDVTKLQDFGGQKVNAAVIGGLKIAGIEKVYMVAYHRVMRFDAHWRCALSE